MTDTEILTEILGILQRRFPQELPPAKLSLSKGERYHIRVGVSPDTMAKLRKLSRVRQSSPALTARVLLYEGLEIAQTKKNIRTKVMRVSAQHLRSQNERVVVPVRLDIYNAVTLITRNVGSSRSAVCEYLIMLALKRKNNQPKE